ncbi:MAG: DUF2281 domain-containing protein [Candidatus Sericytochromatia bacterium]|nr:DUF2281 domain-containing protein [Candidatus Sericytochromatia bacterium]
MLNDQQILQDIHSLPPDGQAEVLDFIAFIKQKKDRLAMLPSTVPLFHIQPAEQASGYHNTVNDHDAVLAESIDRSHT